MTKSEQSAESVRACPHCGASAHPPLSMCRGDAQCAESVLADVQEAAQNVLREWEAGSLNDLAWAMDKLREVAFIDYTTSIDGKVLL